MTPNITVTDTLIEKPREKINVTLDNDRLEIATAWETTPSFIARQISKSLSERVVIARVDGELWDLDRPLEKSCRLELLDFEHPEGQFRSVVVLMGREADSKQRRQKGFLAFECACPRRSCRTAFWLSPVPGTAHRRWIFLRDGPS